MGLVVRYRGVYLKFKALDKLRLVCDILRRHAKVESANWLGKSPAGRRGRRKERRDFEGEAYVC